MYLRWVGGKSSIAKDLINRFPKASITTYIEPFLGSASMYLRYNESLMKNLYYEIPSTFYLSDTNSFLINCHTEIRDNVSQVCKLLREIEEVHNQSTDKLSYYQEMRSYVTDKTLLVSNPTKLAAYFIYINKTCFNGLWRENSKGINNVPFNKKSGIRFDYDLINRVSLLLEDAHIYARDFDQIANEELGSKSFVYMDPPYVPLSSTSSFTSYTSKGFNLKDLERLVSLCKKLDASGTKWMLCNSSAPIVYEKFANWKIDEIQVHRFVKAITAKNAKREKIKEVVITNY